MITDAQLASIDKLVSGGKPRYCEVPHPDKLDISQELLQVLQDAGFVSVAAIGYYRYEDLDQRSLWLRRADDRCAPILHVLATVKFGTLPDDSYPVWKSGKPEISLENVELALKGVAISARSRFGVPTGTAEYRRRYYSKPENREKQNERSRKAMAKRRKLLEASKQVLSSEERLQLAQQILLPDGRKGLDDDRLTEFILDPIVQEALRARARALCDITGMGIDEAFEAAKEAYLEELAKVPTGQVHLAEADGPVRDDG